MRLMVNWNDCWRCGIEVYEMKKRFLEGARSCCSLDARLVTAKENHSEYRGMNRKRQAVRLFHVDGGIIRDKFTERCDYLLMNDDLKEAYFIELKSSKIRHAYEQINKTIRMARESLHGYEMYKRIVFNGKVTIGVTQSWLIRERIKAGKSSRGRDRLRYERALMEECINEDF